jgi:hypothetical protein
MSPGAIEERVRDYVASERAQISVPPLLASRILHAVEVSQPARRIPRLGYLRVAAAVVALLLVGAGIAWMRTAQSPAGLVQGTWSSAPGMGVGRGYQTATLLPNGKVLVVAGSETTRVLASAELYDPRKRTWSPAGTLSIARSLHTATLLKSGKVLVLGGSPASPLYLGSLASAELYDPQTNRWAVVASMHTRRSYHTATLLPDGRVLVVGGIETSSEVSGTTLASAELYDPAANTWTPAAPMPWGRAKHAAIMLADHRVLVIGGTDTMTRWPFSSLPTAELYDPATRSWSSVASMHYARTFPTATLLPDDRVLVVGDDGVNERTAETYDPRSERWSPVPVPAVGRAAHVAVPLQNGAVLVAGGIGETSAQLFDSRRNAWSSAGALAVIRASATATVLDNGQVLVLGGFGSRSAPWTSAELYDPHGTREVVIAPTSSAPVLPGGGAPLLAIPAVLFALGLWLVGRRRARSSGQPDAWIDSET